MSIQTPRPAPPRTPRNRPPAPLDVRKVRDDFPILKQKVHGKPLVYLDNAATTQKPRAVLDAIARYYETYNANVHRAVHLLSELATRAYEQRGAIERGINDYDKALADFAEASKLNPGEIKYHNYRAYIYEMRGDLDNATAENNAALKINPKNKEALERKARLDKIKASAGPQEPLSAPGVPAPPKKKP